MTVTTIAWMIWSKHFYGITIIFFCFMHPKPSSWNEKCGVSLGVSNDAVHLNTLKTLLRLSTVLLDHWKWILSGAIKVRATQVLSKYKGFSTVFPKILDAIESVTKFIVFPTPLSIQISNTNSLGFVCFKIELNVGSEISKINLQKIVRNLLRKLRKSYMTERSSRNLSPSSSGRKCSQIFYRKHSLSAPVSCFVYLVLHNSTQ